MQVGPRWIRIEMEPAWAHIRNLRRFVREFCVTAAVPAEVADQVAMTTTELLENATKYASTAWIAYEMQLSARFAEVAVTNCANAAQQRILREFLTQVMTGDPLAIYVEALERAPSGATPVVEEADDLIGFGEPGVDAPSQSGLARIRYEADADLSIRQEGDRVCVVARIPV